MERRIDVGVLGATGMVGQQFVLQLANHPWFRLAWLGASERSAGQRYGDAAPWRLPTPPSREIADMRVEAAQPGNAPELVFSAMDASVAGAIEQAFAKAGHVVVSNSRNHRMDADVPLLIPEVNGDHIALVARQRASRGWPGAIVTNPNCSTVVPLDGARTAARVRLEVGRAHHAPGAVGRRLPRRRLARRGRQRHSLHRRRRGEDRERDAEDPRHAGRRPHRAAPGRRERADDAGAGRERPHRVDRGRARERVRRSTRCARRSCASAGRRSAMGCRRRRSSRSSTCTSRTGRSRGSTSIAITA